MDQKRISYLISIIFILIAVCIVSVTADEETGIVDPETTGTPTVNPTPVPTEIPTALPTETETTTGLVETPVPQPTEVPTIDVILSPTDMPSSGQAEEPLVQNITANPPDDPGISEILPPGDTAPSNETTSNTPLTNETVISGLEVTNTTLSGPGLANSTQENPVDTGENNYTWSDPPLNTSTSDNPYYHNTGGTNGNWIINESGHVWQLDVANSSGPNYNSVTNTFSNFGSAFAILINASDVILDGMGVTLNGGGATAYGIIVNNQSAENYATFLTSPGNALGGISITNITLTGFTQAGILFNNVIGNQPGDIPSGITNVQADNNNAGGNVNGAGISLQNSQYIEVSDSEVNNNGGGAGYGYGIFLRYSDNCTISGNDVIGNEHSGIRLERSNNNTIELNNASYSQQYEGIWISSSKNNTLSGNTLFHNQQDGMYLGDDTTGGGGSINNTIRGNFVSGNPRYGIYLNTGSHNTTVTDNYIHDNSAPNYGTALVVFQSNYATISRNNVSGNKNYGIYINQATPTTLSDNTVNGNGNVGIFVTSSNYNTLTGNTANNNGQHGFHLEFTQWNNVMGNTASANTGNGFDLHGSAIVWYNNLTDNYASGNENGFGLYDADTNTFTGNTATLNRYDGFNLSGGSSSNVITGNYVTSNGGYGISVMDSSGNTIYNNYFNNARNARVSTPTGVPGPEVFSTIISANTWNVTPQAGPNVIGGPYIGGNAWATPSGTGWSQTHPDIGNGFTEPYNITCSTLVAYQGYGNGYPWSGNIDYHPLVITGPTPTPTQSPVYSVGTSISNPPATPYDSEFTGTTIPSNVQACHSYNVTVSVKNTGTLNWTSANGVVLVPSSADGITFTPNPVPIPEGVVIQPGETWNVPFTFTVPCSQKDGTCTLRFKVYYTLQTKTGQVIVPFGASLSDNVIVGTTSGTTKGLKAGEKFTGTITPEGTRSLSFAGIKTVNKPAPIYTVSVPKTVSNRFPVISTLVWIGSSGEE